VLRTAVKLADEAGAESLTMRRLAKELGVEAMSLYNHVPGKEALLDGMVDLVWEEIDSPSTDADWRTAMRTRALQTRDALRRHPWAIGIMEARSAPGPENIRVHEAVLACLRGAGFSLAETVHAYNLQDSYIYGFTLQEKALPAEMDSPEGGAAVAARQLPFMPPGELPFLREMVGEHIARNGFDFQGEFEFGLDLILDGLERRRDGA
jgi:AcrR family transcriptional regulator